MKNNNQAIWSHIQNSLCEAISDDFFIESCTPVGGGDINQAFHLSGKSSNQSKKNYFVKLNQFNRYEMFAAEAEGLSALTKTNTIKVSDVVTLGNHGSHSFLVLEYLQLGRQGAMEDFATALAALHATSASSFGFSSNNYIGSTPQVNQWSLDWIEFFAEHRIGYQLQLLSKKGVSSGLLSKGNRLRGEINKFFVDYSPKPALIHGDLWQGNYAFDQNFCPVIYDPACYFADHEVELAMLELFGNPDGQFFESYNKLYPIHSGYLQRKNLYNLYHILNHANLFGGGYASQAEAMIDALLTIK